MFALSLALTAAFFLVGARADARSEYQLGVAGTPWQQVVTEGGSVGVYQVFDTAGEMVRTVPVESVPQSAGSDTMIDFSGGAIQARWIDPSINLTLAAEESPRGQILLPYIGGRALSTDRCISWGNQQLLIKQSFDGNPATAQFRDFLQRPNSSLGTGTGWGEAIVIDLGADVPVNRVRFYPRLSRTDDATLIRNMAAPRHDLADFGTDSFVDNFVNRYEIRVGTNAVKFGNDPCAGSGATFGAANEGRLGGPRFLLRWVQQEDPLLSVVKKDLENLDVVTDVQFPTRQIRWIALDPFPVRNWELAEIEVYGEGFVEQTSYVTPILDFGRPVNWGKIRWDGVMPEGTRVQIRTRSGNTPDPNLYFTPSVNGDLEQISRQEFDKIDVAAQLAPVYDEDNWSFWSPPYNFAAGRRDPQQPAEAWQDGTSLLSPSPSRYLQIDIRLFASSDATPRLDQFTLQFAEAPSAERILGEIWPTEVESFDPTTFTYVITPVLVADNAGFDRLEILTHVRPDTVRAVLIDGEAVDLTALTPEIQDDRLVISFPSLKGDGDNLKQVEVVFDVAVLRFGSEFAGWVFSSDDPDRIKQRIEPGNATLRFSGDLLAVQTPVGGSLLRDVTASPDPFTPNGDGRNDAVQFAYKLREVTGGAPVHIEIFDLSGRLVTQLPATQATSGLYTQSWNGGDLHGRLVPPGNYLWRLTLQSKDEHVATGILTVAY